MFTGGIETFFTIPQQVFLFLASVILGGVLGIIYDIFRTVRIIFPAMGRKIPTAAADILYMLIFGMGVFMLSAFMGRGQVRLFYAAGAALGALMYILTVGNAVTDIIRKIYNALAKIFGKLLSPIIKRKREKKLRSRPDRHGFFVPNSRKSDPKIVRNYKKSKKNKISLKILLKKMYDLVYNIKVKENTE